MRDHDRVVVVMLAGGLGRTRPRHRDRETDDGNEADPAEPHGSSLTL
jgi:hypothetical protein